MGLRAIVVGLLALVSGCARSHPVVAPTVVFVGAVAGSEGAPPEASEPEGGPSFQAKDEVEVEWRGTWWPAVVLEKRGHRWLVHYEGYGSDWDEVVGRERIRERHVEAQPEESDAVEEERP